MINTFLAVSLVTKQDRGWICDCVTAKLLLMSSDNNLHFSTYFMLPVFKLFGPAKDKRFRCLLFTVSELLGVEKHKCLCQAMRCGALAIYRASAIRREIDSFSPLWRSASLTKAIRDCHLNVRALINVFLPLYIQYVNIFCHWLKTQRAVT